LGKHSEEGKSHKLPCINLRNVEESLPNRFGYVALKNNCDRCSLEIEGPRFIFYEVDQRDKKYTFGIFCNRCTIELLDQLKGKLEWFHTESGWKGYIRPEARSRLEQAGIIHPNHNAQSIEINQIGQKSRKIGRTEVLEILSDISRRTDFKSKM